MTPRHSWTPERVNELRTHAAAGLTAAQIAHEMGEGLTRNAILGKCFRIGLTLNGGPEDGSSVRDHGVRARHRPRAAPKRVISDATRQRHSDAMRLRWAERKAEQEAQAARIMPVPPTCEPIGFDALDANLCRYPMNDGAPWLFCGARPAAPYCPYHTAIAYVPAPRKAPRRVYALRRAA